MRIFLTGATGFVGGHLHKILLLDGHDVVGLSRHAPSEEEGVTWVQGDVSDVESLAEGMAGCDAVIHLVGIIREKPGQTYADVHVGGTEHVVAAMERQGIKRLLHMSALGAGPKQNTDYYRTKWQAEEVVRASGLEFTIFRPSLTFGPGDGFFNLLIHQIRRFPVIPVIGNGEYTFAPVSIHVVVSAYAQALRLNGPTLNRTFELCGPDTLTYLQILDILSSHMGIHKPRKHLKESTVMLGSRLLASVGIDPPITQDELAMLVQGNTCSDDSAYQVFDLLKIPLAEGIKEYVRPG